METSHLEKQTGHTAAIFEEVPGLICDGLLMLLERSKLQENGPFHCIVWQGLMICYLSEAAL